MDALRISFYTLPLLLLICLSFIHPLSLPAPPPASGSLIGVTYNSPLASSTGGNASLPAPPQRPPHPETIALPIYIHVLPFFPRTKISIISIEVDAVPELRYLLSVIQNVHLALRDLGIKKISVSTTFSFINLVTTTFPPSSETLQSDGNFSNLKHSPISHLASVSVKFRNEISDFGEEFEFEVVVEEEETETESSVSSLFTGALFFSPV
ncbi:hypothetical protein LINPERPRIM_LOCUS5842 [Linum perenne]